VSDVTVTCAECLRCYPLPESKVREIRGVGIDPLDIANPFVACAVRALEAYETGCNDLLPARAADDAKRALGVATSQEWLERVQARAQARRRGER